MEQDMLLGKLAALGPASTAITLAPLTALTAFAACRCRLRKGQWLKFDAVRIGFNPCPYYILCKKIKVVGYS
ncbi:MAG: hypothetical protein K0S07_990 [Chlamydiales bacterium]|jgi:hypothetical protein|nr:hypothetical protein [Chlamydiales bacterium]